MTITIIILAIISFMTLLHSLKQIHMLQLNSYYNSRYTKWVRANLKTLFPFALVGELIIITYAVNLGQNVLGLIFSIIFLIVQLFMAFKYQKTAKKPLVFTTRVKRMIITQSIILALFIVLSQFFTAITFTIFAIVLLVLSFIMPLFVMLINNINAPIEVAIKRYYINDAKKILGKMPNLKIIGITGSYGKTSTKHAVGRILSEKYNVLITPESYNTPMGIVKTIREQLRSDHEIFVCEMGARKCGDIKEICDIVHPDFGIITSVGPQHLETFSKIENVIKTKFELACAVKKKNGTMFYNIDNDYVAGAIDGGTYKTYSLNDKEKADFYSSDIMSSCTGSTFDIYCEKFDLKVTSLLLGIHNVSNILAASALAVELGLSKADIIYAVSQLKPIEHRLQLKPFVNGALLLDDAYNSNPAGSAEAVNVLATFTDFIKVAVTPGMVELGEVEYSENFKLGANLAKVCDLIYLVGSERSKPIKEGIESIIEFKGKIEIVEKFEQALSSLKSIVTDKHVVLFENDLTDNY